MEDEGASISDRPATLDPTLRPLVGRERELAAIEDFLAAAPDRPRQLLITGDAGIGKSRLYGVAVSAAINLGRRVLECRPTAGEADLSYAALTDLGPVSAPVERSGAGVARHDRLAARYLGLARGAATIPGSQLVAPAWIAVCLSDPRHGVGEPARQGGTMEQATP